MGIDLLLYKADANGNQIYLANDFKKLGVPIDEKRVSQYEQALAGMFELTYKERHEFVDRAKNIHQLSTVHHPETMAKMFQCNCYNFFNKGWCYPSMSMQHWDQLKNDGKTIAKKRANSTRKREHQFITLERHAKEAHARYAAMHMQDNRSQKQARSNCTSFRSTTTANHFPSNKVVVSQTQEDDCIPTL